MCEDPRKTLDREGQRLGELGKNAERQFQNVNSGSAMAFSGKWDNIGRTLLDVGITGSGVGFFVNPSDVDNATGSVTAAERKMTTERLKSEREAATVAEATRVAEAQSLTDQVKSLIRGVTENQKRTPGRAVSLLNSSTYTNSLLGS